MELEEIELEKIYQQAKRFVEAKFSGERKTNIRISILSVMKMLIDLKKMKEKSAEQQALLKILELFTAATKQKT